MASVKFSNKLIPRNGLTLVGRSPIDPKKLVLKGFDGSIMELYETQKSNPKFYNIQVWDNGDIYITDYAWNFVPESWKKYNLEHPFAAKQPNPPLTIGETAKLLKVSIEEIQNRIAQERKVKPNLIITDEPLMLKILKENGIDITNLVKFRFPAPLQPEKIPIAPMPEIGSQVGDEMLASASIKISFRTWRFVISLYNTPWHRRHRYKVVDLILLSPARDFRPAQLRIFKAGALVKKFLAANLAFAEELPKNIENSEIEGK